MAEEKIFTIPLRKAFRKSRKKRVPYAVRLIQDYLKRHLKVGNVKLGSNLNSKLWERSIEKPPRRVRVSVVIEDGIAKAELLGHKYKEFKVEPKEKKEGMAEKLKARLGPKALKKQEEIEKLEGKKEEKKQATAEKEEAKKKSVTKETVKETQEKNRKLGEGKEEKPKE
jgi:large subunit ribosomal protein L31e